MINKKQIDDTYEILRLMTKHYLNHAEKCRQCDIELTGKHCDKGKLLANDTSAANVLYHTELRRAGII